MILEIICSTCNGEGNILRYLTFYKREMIAPCLVCRGRGKILTDEGKDIIETLKYYMSESFIEKQDRED